MIKQERVLLCSGAARRQIFPARRNRVCLGHYCGRSVVLLLGELYPLRPVYVALYMYIHSDPHKWSRPSGGDIILFSLCVKKLNTLFTSYFLLQVHIL